MSRVARPSPPRLALNLDEAAASLGMSRTTFTERILPDLEVVDLGSRTLVPVSKLEAWLVQHAQRRLA